MRQEESGQTASVAILLTLSGGFLDAFTYVGHNHVFANTMTGNIVLLGVSLAAKNLGQAAHHIPPLIAFILAVLTVHLFSMQTVERRLKRPALVCLLMECVFLSVAAIFPISDRWLIPGVSFTATLQTLSFTYLEGMTYSSVMTTGNLRNAAKRFFEGLLPLQRDEKAYHDALLLGAITFSFCAGALAGAYTVVRFERHALGVVVFLLIAALLKILCSKTKQRSETPGGEDASALNNSDDAGAME